MSTGQRTLLTCVVVVTIGSVPTTVLPLFISFYLLQGDYL